MTADGGARRAMHLRISGRVQGVWFRGWTVDQARALGLDGWVRNRADGTVEALAAGPAAALAELIVRCRTGPPAARVAAVEESPAEDPGPTGFSQLPTV